jgi:hypothetical protein
MRLPAGRSTSRSSCLPGTDGGKLFKRLLRDQYRRTADTSDSWL